MATIATLVVGIDGSFSRDGRSAGVSSPEDRRRFLARRRNADCIFIGGKTARTEPYHRTPVPVVVVSRSMINAIPSNRLALWWNTTPEKALLRAKKSFGENILAEGGPELVTYLADRGLIDGLELSVTQATGGDEKFDYQALLAKFSNVAQEVVAETFFYSATL